MKARAIIDSSELGRWLAGERRLRAAADLQRLDREQVRRSIELARETVRRALERHRALYGRVRHG